MSVEHNERNTYLWGLAQARTADFITGLGAGMDSVKHAPDMVSALTKMSASRNLLIEKFGDIAFKDIKVRSLELIHEHDWQGSAAIIEGMQEGVEYMIDKQLQGEVV